MQRASRHRSGTGLVDVDLATGVVQGDAAVLALLGLDELPTRVSRDVLEAVVHPDDVAGVLATLEAAAGSVGDFALEARVVTTSGPRVVVAHGRTLPDAQGAPGRVVLALEEAERGHDAAQVQQVLETMAIGYVTVAADWSITDVNSEGERILGRAATTLLGRDVWQALPALVGSELADSMRSVAEEGGTMSFDTHHAPWDAWFEVRVTATSDGGVAVYFLDVTGRRRAQEASEEGLERSVVLAAVAGELADNFDAEAALVNVLKMLVPRFADWGIVSTLDDGTRHWRERLRDIGSWHPDPALHAVAEDYRTIRVAALTEESPVGVALATDRPATISRAGKTPPGQLLAPGRAHTLLTRLAPHATVVLPLRGRGRTRGLLTLVNGVDRGAFSDRDISTLEEVTSQLGLALDNIRLYDAERSLSEELQRSLLTELPEPDHLHLVARYAAASDGAQIGGDWYDAFLVRDGSTCLVVGDVTGHDRGAAVAMAQIRNVLRGVAHAVVRPPAAVLDALDLALRDLAVGSLGTAVLAKLEQTPADAAIGVRRLHWSNAGHLPPLVVHADGSAELLDRPHDVLLGLVTDARRGDHVVELVPDATVVLYTDGLVERRGEHLDVGLERLRSAASRLLGLHRDSLQGFCDALVDELAPDSEDDVAVLVARLSTEDGPRSPDAGPQRMPEDLTREAPVALGTAADVDQAKGP